MKMKRREMVKTRCRLIACSSRKALRGPPGLTSPSDGQTLPITFAHQKQLFLLSTQAQASTDQPLCFKSLIMATYQSVVNINIIMKVLIGHKAFVSLCTLSHCTTLSLCTTTLLWYANTLNNYISLV